MRMSVINFLSFDAPFLGNKGKIKLARSQNMRTTLIHTFLRKTEQIFDILLISEKSGWSDLDSYFCSDLTADQAIYK